MVLKYFLLSVIAFSLAFAQTEDPDPSELPTEPPACSGELDLVVLLDSSSSIGEENFELMKSFSQQLTAGLDIGEETTHVAGARYNSWTEIRFTLSRFFTNEEVSDAFGAFPYYGEGTKTAQALLDVANNILQPYAGWRENEVPTVVIVVTDGISQDNEFLLENSNLLKLKTTKVIAIGIGDRIEIEELNIIASPPASENVIILDDFTQLAEVDRLNDLLASICSTLDDVNECLVDNGGCDQRCTNLDGSFFCSCNPGYILDGSSTCLDIDECLEDNGGCDQICINLPGGFECACNPGFVLSGLTNRLCVEDSCFENNDCSQICNNVVGGDFFCSCEPGFLLAEDGVTCVDIDECAVDNGGCETNCTNTPGSFFCSCDPGFGLAPDGKRCGIQCYVCDRVTDNDLCELQTCPPSEVSISCQTEVRVENGVSFISKSCKQTDACVNNFIQNPRDAFSPTQCNDNGEVSVCRCCCHTGGCNFPPLCDINNEIDISCPDPALLFELVPPMTFGCESQDLYRIGDVCPLVCPPGFGPDNGVLQLDCVQRPRSTEGTWRGVPGRCVDINECLVDNGGCSHGCENTNGSFTCTCPAGNVCSEQNVDLFFILDSSSSVGSANFNLTLEFVTNIGNEYTVGQESEDTRVGVLTFNRDATKRFDLSSFEDNAEFTTDVEAIPYAGRGTKTAQAITAVLNDCLGTTEGRRPSDPLVVVIITDGRSQDAEAIPAAAARLLEVATTVFVIGVSDRVNEQQISELAGGNRQNYRLVDRFEDLGGDIRDDLIDQICTQPELPQFLTSNGLDCDADECSVNNGGCSNNCTNTVGSFFCSCPVGFALLDDGKTCVPDNCTVNNGGCEVGCIPLANNQRRCFCGRDQTLVDETDCVDHDECLDENGGCSDICTNLDPGYVCSCFPGRVLRPDGETCEADSCESQEPPFICSQICTNTIGGSYVCSCNPGFVLVEGTGNCTDIDECAGQNQCEFQCENTPGSFVCICPEGTEVLPNGFNCGIECFACTNAATNDECTDRQYCAPSQEACYATIRVNNNVTRITKGCIQKLACINNLLQNNQRAGEGPTQCNDQRLSSKCECCCDSSLCNQDLCPYDFPLPTCPLFTQDFISFTGVINDDDYVMVGSGAVAAVSAGGTAYVNCPSGFEFSPGSGAGLTQINCELDFVTLETADWSDDPADLGTCVDIDECADNATAGCIAPAMCQNLPGSFECVCPTVPEYELINGVICERDECEDPDENGCSHNCTNLIPGFECFCPPGLSLLEDGRTCVRDRCGNANGGCEQVCTNLPDGVECSCNPGMTIWIDGVSCVDLDECLEDNGGCSNICTNEDPGFSCSCPDGFILDDDGFNCLENPCAENNGGCDQICTLVEGAAICSCRPGFNLLDDGMCIDIDECENLNPQCEFNCTNTEGSFICNCPDGTALRPDGRTCGRACYVCNGGSTNAECNIDLQVCPESADACQNEVRVSNGVTQIFKQCQQSLACDNNFIQNPRAAAVPSQCNTDPLNSVCRCCCTDHLCNLELLPCLRQDQCDIEEADVIVVADSSSSVRLDNFRLLLRFVGDLFRSFNLGDGQVHAAFLRYNSMVLPQFGLTDPNDERSVLRGVMDTMYDGSGTRTGQALTYVLDNILPGAFAARPDVIKIVITITDGRSQDDVLAPSEALRAAGAITFAVGVGDLNPELLFQIAGATDRTFESPDFSQLADIVLGNLQEAVCVDVNECAENNGGCDGTCVNTRTSYFCECPTGQRLARDLRSCENLDEVEDPSVVFQDFCADNNGGCTDVCVNTGDSFMCTCPPGFSVGADAVTCTPTNDCENNNCSHTCVDTITINGGFFCECPIDLELAEDGVTCVPRPGPADCPSDAWLPIAGSCMTLTDRPVNYNGAVTQCGLLDSARPATIDDFGTLQLVSRAYSAGANEYLIGLVDGSRIGLTEDIWYTSAGTVFSNFTEPSPGWADGEPQAGDCAYLTQARFFSTGCGRKRVAVCEIPRENGFALFSSSWDSGAQGVIYLPFGVSSIRVTFPVEVVEFNVWAGTIQQEVVQNLEYIVTQSPVERQSGNEGTIGFTINMNERFPVSLISIEPYTP